MLSVYHAYVGFDYLFVPSVCHVFVCRVHSAVCNVCEYNVLYQCGVSVCCISVVYQCGVSVWWVYQCGVSVSSVAHLFMELN